MLVAPVLGCARLGWSFARLTRGWLASSAFAVLGATPALLLTTSGFGVASPLWMRAGLFEPVGLVAKRGRAAQPVRVPGEVLSKRAHRGLLVADEADVGEEVAQHHVAALGGAGRSASVELAKNPRVAERAAADHHQ